MATEAGGSVTFFLGMLTDPGAADGRGVAAEELLKRYYARMVRLARARLGRKASGGEEDVALSAFYNFYRSAGEGCYPWLNGRRSLWGLLMTITKRKALNLIRDEGRRPKLDEAALAGAAPEGAGSPWEMFAGPEPNPALAALFSDQVRALMDALSNDQERAVARLKLERYKNKEIAEATGISLRGVERKLEIIRDVWSDYLGREGVAPGGPLP